MKRMILAAAMVLGALAQADIVLEFSNNGRAVIFADGDQVFFEKCVAGAKAARGCSGADRSTVYSADAERFVRSVQSFYGVVDPLFAGRRGGQELNGKIQGLQTHLDQDELTANELVKAEKVLLEMVRIGDKLDLANREVLQFLTGERSTTINEEYQGDRFTLLNLAFYAVAYSSERHKVYVATEPVTFDKAGAACSNFGKEWRPLATAADLDLDFRHWIAKSAALPAPVTRVWTLNATGSYYLFHCSSIYNKTSRYEERSYSPAQLHDIERKASEETVPVLQIGPCGYMSWQFEVDRSFIPGGTAVVDLGPGAPSDAPDVIEPVEAGEGVVASTAHPVVCQKDFQFGEGVNDANYLNGEHFADFSLYRLEDSLERMAKSVYSNRAEFFREVAKGLSAFPLREADDIRFGFRVANGRLFVLLAIEPLLHDIQSKFVDSFVLPDYNRAKEQWSKKLGVGSLGDVDFNEASYKLAVGLLTYGLKASEAYLNADDKKTLQVLVPALGKALAAGPSGLRELNLTLADKTDLFTRLGNGRRTKGFGQMGVAIRDWLKDKSR